MRYQRLLVAATGHCRLLHMFSAAEGYSAVTAGIFSCRKMVNGKLSSYYWSVICGSVPSVCLISLLYLHGGVFSGEVVAK
jgi:hypothetical protein